MDPIIQRKKSREQNQMNRIMLIDDNETMALLLKTLLELEGYQVIFPALNNGDGLLKSIYDQTPDTLLLDVHLNGIDGIEILTKLRSDPAMQSLKIFMTSGTDMTQECMQNHADGFLLKPYMPDDLLKILRRS